MSCGYGIELELKLMCGTNSLQTLSSTPYTITLKTLSINSIIILEIGDWG